METKYSKEQIIKAGLDRGLNARQMDKLLGNFGYGKYNPLLYSSNYTNIPGNIAENARDLARGLTTVGGEFIKPIQDVTAAAYQAPYGDKMEATKRAFIKAVNTPRIKNMAKGTAIGAGAGSIIPGVGTVGGAITGGLVGLLGPKEFTNATLATYGLSTDAIKNRNVDIRDIAQGIMDNPLYVGMDVAGIGGIGKSIGKGAKSLAGKAGVSQQLLSGSNLADFNRQITNEKLWSKTNAANLYGGFNELKGKPLAKRAEIARNISMNTGKLTEADRRIANQLKQELIANEEVLVKAGIYEKDFVKNNTIAQYVMGNILKDSKLIHKDIMDILTGKPLDARAIQMLSSDAKLKNRVYDLIKEGNKLYNNKQIAWLSQELANTVDPSGKVIARHVNLDTPEGQYSRIIGRATPEQLGDVLDDTIKAQLDKVSYVNEGLEVFKGLMDSDKLGVKLTPAEKKLFLDKFTASVRKDIKNGVYPSLLKALEDSAIDTKLEPHIYKAMQGAFEIPTQGAGYDFLNYWKKSVLGTPTWTVGNRLGNWSLNAIEGVNFLDYADIKKYHDYIPDVLKQQTAFNSYINIGNEALSKADNVGTAIAEPISQLRNAIGRYKQSKKTLSDFGRLASGLYGGTSNLFANPIFRAEAALEYMDRAANFIRQAKREAKATGKSVEAVLKQAKTDKNLFLKLNTQVNKSLGDYLGKNYAAPKTLREGLSWLVPFYRFPVQTVRTTLHGMANRPIGFATNVILPARAGAALADKYQQLFQLDPSKYEGGTPYYADPEGKFIRTLSITPTPIGMIAGRLTNMDDFLNMINPSTTNIRDALSYQKFGKIVTSPTYNRLKLTDPQAALEYKGNASDRTKYILHNLLGSTYNPYINISRFGPEVLALIRGKGMYSPYGMNPFKQDPIDYPYKKNSPLEIAGNILNISTKSQYKKKNDKNRIKRAKRLQQQALKNYNKSR